MVQDFLHQINNNIWCLLVDLVASWLPHTPSFLWDSASQVRNFDPDLEEAELQTKQTTELVGRLLVLLPHCVLIQRYRV